MVRDNATRTTIQGSDIKRSQSSVTRVTRYSCTQANRNFQLNTDRTVGAQPQRVVRSSVSRNEVPQFAQVRPERPSGRIIRSSVTHSRREDLTNHTPTRERVIRGPRIEGQLGQTPVAERIVRGPPTQRKEYGVLTPSREIRHSESRQYTTKNADQMCHTDLAEKY
jgi:hypothetical protein